MKHITDFSNFKLIKESIDDLNKNFRNLFNNTDQDISIYAENFYKDIKNKKKPIDIITQAKNVFRNLFNIIPDKIDESVDPLTLKTTLDDFIFTVYYILEYASEKLNSSTVTLSNIMGKDTPKLFKRLNDMSKNTKDYRDNITEMTKEIIKSQAEKAGFEKTDIDTLFDEKTDKEQPETDNTNNNNTEPVQDENTLNLKENIKTWVNDFSKVLEKGLNKQTTDVKSNTGEFADVDNLLDKIKGTKNPDDVKKMIKKILQITDKSKFEELRNFLLQRKIISPDDNIEDF